MKNSFNSYQNSARWNFPNCRPAMKNCGSGQSSSGENTNRPGNNAETDQLQNMAIAMAYVPWQRWDTVYKEEVGLDRGTIFPELDLPFLGEEVM